MPNTIDASIIITTFNRPHFLDRAITSCINQVTNFIYEIIVVDDNGLGTDYQKQTQELVLKYQSQVGYLPLNQNSGACVARNRGVEQAKGRFIFFLDDDDEYLPNKVQDQLTCLMANPDYDGCLFAMRRLDEAGNEIEAASNNPSVGSFQEFVCQGNFFTPMLCIRKISLDKIGGFDTIPRFQDRYLMIKALANNQKFITSNQESYILYEHNDSRVTHTNIEKSFKALDMIKQRVLENKKDFSKAEWQLYIDNEMRMKATMLYLSNNLKNNLKASKMFAKVFASSHSKSDLLGSVKCLVKMVYKK